ncbi:MAG: Ada metal-binding domain-containing protein [Phycisphaerae bacterium]|nr:Ada metal-binding domain-containing protein [Phycisphaerae bacterium]
MKKLVNINIMLFILLIPAVAICASANITKKPNAALAGIERFYVVIDQQQRIITSANLPAFVDKLFEKFKQAGLTVVAGVDSADIKRDPNIPELIIYIDTIYLGDNQAVGLVELSFATKTRLEGQDFAVKANVWRAKPVLGTIDKSKIQERIKTAILKEVDSFIIECIFSKENIKLTEPVKPEKSSENKQTQTAADDKTEFPFVASRSSRIYHKADCPSAKRITPTNLIRFKTKDEANQSGRRPCQRCKP